MRRKLTISNPSLLEGVYQKPTYLPNLPQTLILLQICVVAGVKSFDPNVPYADISHFCVIHFS